MTAGASPHVWHRGEAIPRLRASLLAMTDEDHSLCQIAGERGIFCRGFRRWGEAEFDRRWRKYIGRSTHLSREQMEEYANLWELAEQIRKRVSLACDAQTTQSSRVAVGMNSRTRTSPASAATSSARAPR